MFTSSDATGNFVTESFIEEVESMYGGVDVPQDGDYVFEEGTYINETEGEFITPGFDDFTTALVDDGNGNLIISQEAYLGNLPNLFIHIITTARYRKRNLTSHSIHQH